MAIDHSRKTEGLITLPAEISKTIWSDTIEQSVIQSRGTRISIPAGGVKIPIITGDPVAEWVGETELKPVSKSTVSSKTITPYKMAVVQTFSDEFRRDYNGLYSQLVERLPKALATTFDKSALGFAPSPGTGFDTLAAAPSVAVGGYEGYLDALRSVTAAKGDVTAWQLSPDAEIDILGYTDTAKRPLFISDVKSEGSIGSVLARPVYKSRNVASGNVVGFAGEWSGAYWGTVEDIKIKISDQASIKLPDGEVVHLFQQNMFAIIAEFEVGFAVRDVNRFVKLTKAPAGS